MKYIENILKLDKEAQYAWAAGFFDGEGHAGLQPQNGKTGPVYPGQRISITQWYDTSALETFKKIFEIGNVENNIYLNPQAYRYREQGMDNVLFILDKIKPYLSNKKLPQVKNVINTINKYKELKKERQSKCKNGHSFTPENTYINVRGVKECYICRRKYNVDYRKRKKEKLNVICPSS